MLSIKKICLHNFRNYQEKIFEFSGEEGTILIGKNGCGKTNLLESISLLTIGRSLKNSYCKEIVMYSKNFFSVNFEILDNNDISNNIRIAYDAINNKKSIKINNSNIKGIHDISSIMKIYWYTPNMLFAFLSDKNFRRKFIDRIAYNHNSNHLHNMIKYEELRKQRIKILLNNYDDTWLSSIEKMMAQYAIKIAQDRKSVIDYLNSQFSNILFQNDFIIRVSMVGKFESQYDNSKPDDENIVSYIMNLCEFRDKDKKTGKTHFGINVSDFSISADNQSIHFLSTGQQKTALLMTIISSIKDINQSILLIDDLCSCFDENNLYSFLSNLREQKIYTISSSSALEKRNEMQKFFNLIQI
ncbi:AAA family ATPase [Anaplasmataceae bacterium AB001_6]|nr:AAA family ATPase [Anaplasmataceae bacterium AB001_6]